MSGDRPSGGADAAQGGWGRLDASPYAERVAEDLKGVKRAPEPKVALSTASVYPEPTSAAFEMAARLGYDGVEVMVWTDPVSQDVDALRRLADQHGSLDEAEACAGRG